MARQFNLIPPVCEQAEYHYFQRDKVEVQLPELYHKIGQTFTPSQLYLSLFFKLKVHFVSFKCLPCFFYSGVGAMTWSPLACGLITGKYSDGVPECSRAAMKVSLIGLVLLWDFSLKISPSVIFSLISELAQCEISTDELHLALSMLFSILLLVKGYQWLKERVNSEEGRRQLAKIKELHLLADRLGCTAAQLAIGIFQANDIIPLKIDLY